MSKFDIAIIASVEASSIDEARAIAYKAIESWNSQTDSCNLDLAGYLTLADDSATDRINQRVVFLHPEDVDNEYDFDSYQTSLKREKEYQE